MSIKLFDILQNIVTEKTDITTASKVLDEETKEIILRWYLQYSDNKEADIQTILNLLCFLYYKHDIDMTNPSIYLETIDYLSKKYFIKRDTFLNMLSDFRVMAFSYK